ncbi:hypothetical protein HYU06_07340 [Candidatus Woesearchaeota archaeon]|nr:hypothetical protein [Candidatus Woesearchaeota archaeon]
MSSAKEQDRLFPTKFENDEYDVAAATTVTYYIVASGTDSTNARYLNLGAPSIGISVIPTQIIQVTHINNKQLKVPMTIGTNGWIEDRGEFTTFVVVTGTAANIKVGVKR